MKGKVAFVLGAAVGYVLGARAGRARYEKIKSGAKAAWESEPVQNGVAVVQGAASAKVAEVKAAAFDAGKDALAAVIGSSKSSHGSSTSQSNSTSSRGSESQAKRDAR